MQSPPSAPASGRFTATAAGAAVVAALAGCAVATAYDRAGTAVFAGTLSFTFAIAAVAVVGAVITLAVSRNRVGWLLLAAAAVMGAGAQHRALDEIVQLGQVVGPAHVSDQVFGLRPGGVEHEHINRAETAGDRGDQVGNLLLIGDVGANASATPPPSPMLPLTSPARSSPRRPLTATARPSRARRRAIAAPRPRELPVTNATL